MLKRSDDMTQFQSTHPVRGATNVVLGVHSAHEFQSTHPVRGATVHVPTSMPSTFYFNPRTP